MGQFVTPQNTETMPMAAHSGALAPVRMANRQPNVAPVKNEGTISPPLKPAPMVSAVKRIFKRKANAAVSPCKARSMIFMPGPR